jgi:hypothetical protein
MGRRPNKKRKSSPGMVVSVELFLLLLLVVKVGTIVHQVAS